MPSNKKILIITYYWPPCGGAGVQRWLKFTKYMPEFGWEPCVLTVDPDYALYPAIDESLEKDIHPSLKVHKTKAINYFRFGKGGTSTGKVKSGSEVVNNNIKNILARFIRGNFFIPDPRKGWNRYAVSKASQLIREEKINYVVTTSPPHSTQLIGLKLKSLFPDIIWICDLRDPWTDIYYYNIFYPTFLSKTIDKKFEKAVMQTADFISTAGNLISQSKIEDYQLDKSKLIILLNGFDENDFSNIEIKKPSIFTITYAGSISEQYPVNSFIKALKEVLFLSKSIRVRFLGSTDQKLINRFQDELPSEVYRFIPYLNHKEAIKYMINSHMLLLIIPKHTKNKTIIPGKIFEYMRSGNPILSIGPSDSDVKKILKDNNAGENFENNDSAGIFNYIITEYEKKSNKINPCSNQFNRKIQINEFLRKVSS